MTPDRRPSAFLIGAARSGTSYIAHSLSAHDRIGLTDPKEPHFMAFAGQDVEFKGPGDDRTINSYTVTDLEQYQRSLAEVSHLDVRLDASVTSLYHFERSIQNIRIHATEAPRFVAVLRDPVERAFSNFAYQRSRGLEPFDDFTRALAAEEGRRSESWQHMFHYRNLGDYAAGIEAFREAFGAESLLVVFHDDLIAEPLDVLNRICTHLSVQEFEAPPLASAVNASGTPRLRVLTFAQAQLHRYPRLRKRLRRNLPLRIREQIRTTNLSTMELADEDRARLREEWSDLYDRLENIVGPLPSSWSRVAERR